MSRITLNSANSAVLIGDSPAFKTTNETGTLFMAVQQSSFSLPQTRQTQKQVGSCYYAVDDLVRHPDIDLSIDYYFSPSMLNEKALGFNLNYGFSHTEPNSSLISGIDNKSNNFYFYNHPEEGFDAIEYLTSGDVDSPNNGEIISFGNAYLVDYRLSFATNSIPLVSTSYKCSNMMAEDYTGNVLMPAINLLSGNNNEVADLEVDNSIYLDEDFFGSTVDYDLRFPKLTTPGDLELSLENLQIGGQTLSGANHLVQSMSINMPINRVDLHGLGSDYIRGRKMQYPVRGNLSVASLVSGYGTGFISGLLANESKYSFDIKTKTCNDDVETKFMFDNLKLETFDYSMQVNDKMEYSATFSYYMDNKEHVGGGYGLATSTNKEDVSLSFQTKVFGYAPGDVGGTEILLLATGGDIPEEWVQDNIASHETYVSRIEMAEGPEINVGPRAFYQCSSLTGLSLTPNVRFSDNNFNLSFAEAVILEGELFIPEGWTSVANRCFKDLVNIDSISIPSTVSFIGVESFKNAYKVNSLKCYSTTKPTFSDGAFGPFANIGAQTSFDYTIHVPVGSEAGWPSTIDIGFGQFLNVVFDISDDVVNPPSYNILPQDSFVDEGSSLSVDIETQNVIAGTVLYWSVTNPSQFNVSSGTVTMNSSSETFTVSPKTDSVVGDSDSFQINISTVSGGPPVKTSGSISIIDKTPTVSFVNNSQVNEGSILFVTINTTNIQNQTLYWTLSNVTDFVASSGSFSLSNNSGSFNVQPVKNDGVDPGENFVIQIRTGSTSGPIIETSDQIDIIDVTDPADYIFPTLPASIDEGSDLVVTISTPNVVDSTVLYWSVTNPSEFLLSSGSFTVTGEEGTFTVSPELDDKLDDDLDPFLIQIRTGSISGPVQKESQNILINNQTTSAVTLYRVNAGGPNVAAIDAGMDWESDLSSSPSQYNNSPGADNNTYTVSSPTITNSTISTPPQSYVPEDVFFSHRYDTGPANGEMIWTFPVQNGQYTVNLYFAEIYHNSAGRRFYDVILNGTEVITNMDKFATAGGKFVAYLKAFDTTVTDGFVTIEFIHGSIDHPEVNAIEIIQKSIS